MIDIILFFIIIDYLLPTKNNYYLIHSLTNCFIVYTCFPNLINVYIDNSLETPFYITQVIYSLHLYHVIYYFNKLRFDDWIHHLLSVFIIIPLSLTFNQKSLLGHTYFFLTGLPGMIDYFLLFLNRNYLLDRQIEKKTNFYLNLLIRQPGAILSCAHIIKMLLVNEYSIFEYMNGIFILVIIYWNGIYFMNQILRDYYLNYYSNKHQ